MLPNFCSPTVGEYNLVVRVCVCVCVRASAQRAAPGCHERSGSRSGCVDASAGRRHVCTLPLRELCSIARQYGAAFEGLAVGTEHSRYIQHSAEALARRVRQKGLCGYIFIISTVLLRDARQCLFVGWGSLAGWPTGSFSCSRKNSRLGAGCWCAGVAVAGGMDGCIRRRGNARASHTAPRAGKRVPERACGGRNEVKCRRGVALLYHAQCVARARPKVIRRGQTNSDRIGGPTRPIEHSQQKSGAAAAFSKF